MIRQFFIQLAQAPIRLYQWLVSPLLGQKCRFHPSCSAYTLEALEKHGVFKGFLLGLARILKCHPWCRAHWNDPVPKRFTWGVFFGYKRRQQKTHLCDH